MQKIIFSHSDEATAAHNALREKLKRDTEAFLNAGGKIDRRKCGDTAADDFQGLDAGFSEIARQRAAQIRKKNGNGVAITELQQKTLDAIDRLLAIPGNQVTRLALRNSMRLSGGQLNDRLKSLEKKNMIRLNGSLIERVKL